MKIRTYQCIFLAVLSIMGMGRLNANAYSTHCNPCDCCSVLEPCRWSIAVRGGVAPSHFTHRGHDLFVNPTVTPSFGGFFSVPRLREFAHLPWQIGGEIAWNASNHIQLFMEGYYQRAKGKQLTVFDAPGFVIEEKIKNYRNRGWYLGTRYYPCRICSCFLPFVGFKAGLVYQNTIECTLIVNGLVVAGSPFDFFQQQWAPSVGGQIGFDYRLWCHFSLFFVAEAVITQGLKGNHNIPFPDPVSLGGITNAAIGDVGRIVSYPVTLGLRYQF